MTLAAPEPRSRQRAAKPGGQPRSLLATLRYGSANLLLVLGAAALVIGGWATWVVLALALVFGSFADEVSGDDDDIAQREPVPVLHGESLFDASAGQPFGISPGSFSPPSGPA